jgi:Leucine-rich repeat (LRR) protein
VNLERINLTESKQLMKLPDLSGATKLKWLYLSGCESLREVHSSVFSKDTLVTLLVDRCKKLEILASEKHLTSLRKIDVSGCSSLREFSLSWNLIEELDLSNTGIEILHSSIGRLSKLRRLDLHGLKLKSLPKEMCYLRSLTELELSNCNIVTKLTLEAIFDGLVSLKILYLKDCGNLRELPTNIDSLSSLYELRLDGSNVKMLPKSIKNISSLRILSLDNCKKLGCLPELPSHIRELKADNCISLVNVSSLKALSQSMLGVQKYISFKNNMKLDASSFDRIMDGVILTIKSAAFHNTIAVYDYGYSYNSVHVCLPGRKVPRQFKFRTIGSTSSITIEFPHPSKSFGLIFSVVVSSSYGMKEHGKNGALIKCQHYSEDGSSKFLMHSEKVFKVKTFTNEVQLSARNTLMCGGSFGRKQSLLQFFNDRIFNSERPSMLTGNILTLLPSSLNLYKDDKELIFLGSSSNLITTVFQI